MNHSNPAPAVSPNTPNPPGHTPHALRIARRKLQPGQAGTRKLLAGYGEKDVETTQIYTHVLAKRLQNVRSPADMFGNNGFVKPHIALAELPPALEKRFRDVVASQFKGDMQAALAAFLDLHDKHGSSAKSRSATNA